MGYGMRSSLLWMKLSPLLIGVVFLLTGCAPPGQPPQAAVAPTSVPATATAGLPTATLILPTATAVPPTATAPPATATPIPPTPLPRYDLVLVGVTIIDGTGAAPLPNMALAINGDRIAAIAPAGALVYSADTPVRDLAGASLLPGFINAHAHTHQLSDAELRRWVQAGVTTVRDLSAPLDIVARRDALAADFSVPRLLVSGPMVTVPGGHPIPIYGLNERVLTVGGVADARLQIAALADAGVDVIKIAVSGRSDTSYPELSDAEIAAISETARSRGIAVTAHVDRAVALERAVANGIGDAAHAPRDRIPDALIAAMVQRGVGMVPTVDVYEALAEQRGNAAEWRLVILPVMYDNLRRFAAAGGTLALGDDFGGADGTQLGMPMAEIRHWLAAGIAPLEVIRAATQGSAKVAGIAATWERLRSGRSPICWWWTAIH
ncbi:MAG: amidohydrolase family protein [Oscillochloris sp.]|nr:amidohydrolase family protein [Oscillochloris sp.]